MLNNGCWLLWLVSALFGPPTYAAAVNSGVSVGPQPAWVQVFKAPTLAPDAHKPDPSGGRYLLVDQQLRITPSSKEAFFHYVERVESAAALEHVANIEIGFNPAYQQLIIHSADVVREGVVVHKLDPSAINVLQRERDLEHLIYDGEKTASIFLKDVRVGDTVEYRYTRSGANPVFANRASGTFELQWGVPIEESHGRLLVANNHHMLLHQRNVALTVTQSDSPGYHEYSWTEHSIKAMHVASNTPDFYDPYAALDFSEYRDWHDVAAWASEVFQQAVKSGPLRRAEVARISKEYPDDAGRLLATLRFVQGQIRYLGVEIGPGSQAPNSPETVLMRRFGDCKDKALLAVTMLKDMGIHADAALVNPDAGESLIDQQPSPGNFNHSIVHVEIDGRDFWLDPTWDAQLSDLEHLVQPQYGYALLVRPDTTALSQIPEQASSTRREMVKVKIDSSAGYNKPVLMSIETTYQGLSADRTRHFLASHSKDDVQRDYLNYYKGYYSGASVAELFTVEDSLLINRIVTKEQYRVADFWPAYGDKPHEASFYVMGFRRELHQTDEPIRTSPLSIGEKIDFTESTEVLLPKNFRFAADHDHIIDPAFQFDHRTENGDHLLRLSTRFTKSSAYIASDRVEAYMANAEKADSATRFNLSDRSTAEAASGEGEPPLISTWAPLWLLLTILLVLPFSGRVRRAMQATTLYDTSSLADGNDGALPKVWDPRALAVLSLFFTTFFCACAVAQNWRALGEKKRARWSLASAYTNLLLIIVAIELRNPLSQLIVILIAIALMFAWYLFDVRPQQRRITATAVARRPWGRLVCSGFFMLAALSLDAYLIWTHRADSAQQAASSASASAQQSD